MLHDLPTDLKLKGLGNNYESLKFGWRQAQRQTKTSVIAVKKHAKVDIKLFLPSPILLDPSIPPQIPHPGMFPNTAWNTHHPGALAGPPIPAFRLNMQIYPIIPILSLRSVNQFHMNYFYNVSIPFSSQNFSQHESMYLSLMLNSLKNVPNGSMRSAYFRLTLRNK